MDFCVKLQLLRKDRGMSQEELAEKLGVSRQAVSKWEAGEARPEWEHLAALGTFFRASIDDLVRDGGSCEKPILRNEAGQDSPGAGEGTASLVGFLLRAKRATYAAGGAETTPSRPASHDLRYQEADLFYYDTYLGGERFIGEEAVWIKGKPVWAMNYSGRVTGEGFSGDFLKESLSLVPESMPFRGPRLYASGDYTYHCAVEGSFEWYSGREEIFLAGKPIYECLFHGGLVK
ncbi:MAG: helix-turn-helix transcriptional regulator [Spirochaetales bacterium]|nr:helix-turn-helix transcriptional regulator [Spirochaetales bacterium]